MQRLHSKLVIHNYLVIQRFTNYVLSMALGDASLQNYILVTQNFRTGNQLMERHLTLCRQDTAKHKTKNKEFRVELIKPTFQFQRFIVLQIH
jgi:predicted protein tyrosine phosphatase